MRGRLAGPGELARHGLLTEVPAGYFERYRAQAAARIRESVARARCSCLRPGERLPESRCERCYGVHLGSEREGEAS